jgi:hypothetical protein
MTSLPAQSDRDLPEPLGDDSLLSDWIGLAGYLAEAVAGGDASFESARAELAAEATTIAERRALGRAAEFAATQFGPDSLTTKLLEWARAQTASTADVA